jgi:hypothetical protein
MSFFNLAGKMKTQHILFLSLMICSIAGFGQAGNNNGGGNASSPPPQYGNPPYEITYFANSNYAVKLNWEMTTVQQSLYGFEIYRDGVLIAELIGKNHRTYIDDKNLSAQSEPVYRVYALYSQGAGFKYSTPLTYDFTNKPLPVSLISFRAKARNNDIEITWTTATEINNMGFEIQRLKKDKINWETIGFVEGHNNHNGIKNYSFTDLQPLDGINYYRLKQMDHDGKYEYFGPLAQLYNPDGEFSLKISRIYDQVDIHLPGNEPGLLEVFDLKGRLLYSQIAAGPVSLHDLRGMHIVRFRIGNNTITAKILF